MKALRNRITRIQAGIDKRTSGPGGVLVELRDGGYLNQGKAYNSLADVPGDGRNAYLLVKEPYQHIETWAAEAAAYRPPTTFSNGR